MNACSESAYRPIVIIGAGRSGTNMLRDILCSFPDYGTWPCDEINYIWRHGNIRFPHDEFEPAQARPQVQTFLRQAFLRCAQRESCHSVVEKTCANSLRVGFVAAALPNNTLFIHLVRDGYDVTASAGKRWTAKLDLPYLLKKARFVPLFDLPYYAFRYLGARLYQVLDHEGKLGFWGPCYKDMEVDKKRRSLGEICALQWRRCVERSLEDLKVLPQNRVLHLRYENFVSNPTTELQRIGSFLGEHWSQTQILQSVASVSANRIGKGIANPSSGQQRRIAAIVQPLLSQLAKDSRFRW